MHGKILTYVFLAFLLVQTVFALKVISPYPIEGQNGGGNWNNTFNQSLTDQLYYSASNPLNFINRSQGNTYYLKLDQTTPQIVNNGMPWFTGGIQVGYRLNMGGNEIYRAGTIYDDRPTEVMDPYDRVLTNTAETITFNWEHLAFPTLTSDGFLKTSNSDGTLTVDTASYYNSSEVDTLVSNINNLSNASIISLVNTSIGNYSADKPVIAQTGNCGANQAVQNTTTSGVQCIAITSPTNVDIKLFLYQGNSFSGNNGDLNRSLILTTVPVQLSIDGIIWQNLTDYVLNATTLNLTLYNKVWNDQRIQILGY